MEKEETIIPIKIEKYLKYNFTFNKFGIVNINIIRSVSKTKLSDEELKEAINKRFASEMTGQIEFI